MSKGNKYAASVPATATDAAATALAELATKMEFIPPFGPDDITTATITPERLPLAELAAKMATVGNSAMRKSCDPAVLTEKVAEYHRLSALRPAMDALFARYYNGLNVLGADILFATNNVHEDVEKDNGETFDFGDSRREMNEYYRKNKGGKGGTTPKP